MNKTAFAALAALTGLLAFSSSARAETATPNTYVEIGYAQANLTLGDIGKASLGAVTGVVGYQFTPNMAVEGLLGAGLGSSSLKGRGVNGVDAKLQSAVGVYFKPSFAVSDSIDVFARVGWMSHNMKLQAARSSMDISDSSVSYGLGANFNLSKTSYIHASWMSYFKKDDVKVDGFLVGYGVRF